MSGATTATAIGTPLPSRCAPPVPAQASPSLSPPQLREEGVLKIFAGAEARPVLQERLEWHTAKLQELQGFLEDVGDDPAMAGVRSSLFVGVGYESLIVDALRRYLEDEQTPPAPGA